MGAYFMKFGAILLNNCFGFKIDCGHELAKNRLSEGN